MSTIRVLIVDDHPVVADGLALALSRDEQLNVSGVAGTVADGVKMAREGNPNVVLMDFHLPDGTGAEAAKAIRGHCPEAAVVMLTADGSDDALSAAIEAGASGFLLKSQAATQIASAVHRAADGEMLVPASMLAGLLGRRRAQSEPRRQTGPITERLTTREQEVLVLMADGLDNRAIADTLIISYATVRSHVQNILDKLGAHSKLEAVAQASTQGLLSK